MVDSTVIPYGCFTRFLVSFGPLARGGRRIGNDAHTNVELIDPPMTELRIVLLDNHLQEPILQPVALVGRHVVDLRYVVAHGEKALPARHGVSAHHGVSRCQGRPDVVRRAARRGVQFEALFAGDGWEAGLGEGCCEGFKEGAVRGRDLVVDFAGGGPDCVFLAD
jgi:hypothetical protein